jgi:hypothetical protein
LAGASTHLSDVRRQMAKLQKIHWASERYYRTNCGCLKTQSKKENAKKCTEELGQPPTNPMPAHLQFGHF